MRWFVRSHLTYANVMATIAVFVAFGGSAFAASYVITKSSQIKDGAVTSSDVKNNSLTGLDVKDRSLTQSDFIGSVQGPQGSQGPKGEAGAQGLPGQPGSPDSPQQVLDKLKQVDGPGSGLNADLLDGLNADAILGGGAVVLVPLEAMTFTSATASNAEETVARAAATEVPLGSFGPFTIYGKCFVDTDAGPAATPQVIADVYARTSQDGAMLDGQVDNLVGTLAFLDVATAETSRQVDSQIAETGALASLNGDDDSSLLVAPDGNAYEFRTIIGAKTGNLPAGNGAWGQGDRCGFGFSRFGAL